MSAEAKDQPQKGELTDAALDSVLEELADLKRRVQELSK